MRIDKWNNKRNRRGINIVLDRDEAIEIIARLSAQLAKLHLIQNCYSYGEPAHLISTNNVTLIFSIIPSAAHTKPGESI